MNTRNDIRPETSRKASNDDTMRPRNPLFDNDGFKVHVIPQLNKYQWLREQRKAAEREEKVRRQKLDDMRHWQQRRRAKTARGRSRGGQRVNASGSGEGQRDPGGRRRRYRKHSPVSTLLSKVTVGITSPRAKYSNSESSGKSRYNGKTQLSPKGVTEPLKMQNFYSQGQKLDLGAIPEYDRVVFASMRDTDRANFVDGECSLRGTDHHPRHTPRPW